MVRYKVEIAAFGVANPHVDGMWGLVEPTRIIRNLSLKAAWRVVERAARRGRNLYGGTVARGTWGMRGGTFPLTYRAAVIKVDRIGGRAA